jgi:uncharacterized protein (TIGR02117 family)
MRPIVTATLLLFTAGLAGCLGPPAPAYSPRTDEPVEQVYVVRHGWHTRIAVRQAAVDPAIWPESRDLGAIAWLEMGWGDRDYYPKPQARIWDAIDPVFRPTPAALHVGGFDRPPPEFLPHAPMVRIPISARGLDRLARFIHEHYELRGGDPVRIRPGTYERSWFYLATGRYHAMFNNSNAWVAKALAAAGVPTTPSLAVTASSLMGQAERFGTPTGAADAGHSSRPAGPATSWEAGR